MHPVPTRKAKWPRVSFTATLEGLAAPLLLGLKPLKQQIGALNKGTTVVLLELVESKKEQFDSRARQPAQELELQAQ